MNTFVYSAYIPSLERRIDITELDFNSYKQLIKTITSNNNHQIALFFDNLIREKTKLDPKTLTFLDKLIILLTIRSVCVSDTLDLTFTHPTEKREINTSIKLYNAIEKIEKLNITPFNSQETKIYSNILQVTFGPPSELYFNVTHDSLFSVIKEVKIKNQEIPLDKDQVINNFPISVFKDAKEYINRLEEKINEVILIDIARNEQDFAMALTLLQNSAIEFLKLCYRRDLLSVYETEYILTTKLNIPYDLISKSTFAEIMLYFAFYSKEKKDQEKQQKQTPTGIPLR